MVTITSDPAIMSLVTGAMIEFDCAVESLPGLSRSQSNLNQSESTVIDCEVEKLLSKPVISQREHETGEVISPVFTGPKKDGSYRMILNLKMGKLLPPYHFKMETFNNALRLIRKICFMASIYLTDAYHSVPIHEEHRKLLRFEWKGQVFEFNALQNGLALAPRQFTNLLKPIFASLRKKRRTKRREKGSCFNTLLG